ncbi:hypothetical protein [Actinomadura violacea]|uniref:Uncharacterized protein n=1 Tax=Actinomadura violacea TaxID=2819934 RepID=A0ABS3RYJ9_9ACTN|nr:hypothetical protein [Actinomadura violacea]MBO2461721.1 hypothetical protein [Actinomadura violacea]
MGERETLAALSVRQPYADALCWAGRDVHSLAGRLRYTGPIAIHAPRNWLDVDSATFRQIMDLVQARTRRPWDAESPRRRVHIVAVANLVGQHRAGDLRVGCDPRTGLCSPWAWPERWHHQFTDVRPLPEPVPCPGARGLWRLPPDVDEQVRAQVSI